VITSLTGFRDEVERFLPSAELIEETDFLQGLVRLKNDSFDMIILQLPKDSDDFESILKSYRKVNRSVRILLLAGMFDEPAALNFVRRGLANDYLILPLRPREMDVTFKRFSPAGMASEEEEARVISPYPRFQNVPAGGEVCTSAEQMMMRELSELIIASQRGLRDFLERACWSAVYLFRVKGARISVGQEVVHVGEEPAKHGKTISLIDDGREIGLVELAVNEGEPVNSCFSDYMEQLLPGLIKLASSHGELKELANTDPLTGLANRRHLMETLHTLVERARKERFRVTLVLFDFDNFKHYNDTFGHGAGDEILRESGILIKRCIRRQDMAARYGGDEIAVVLWDWQGRRMPNSEHPRSAMVIMERFRNLLRSHYFTRLGPQVQGTLTISGGLASFPWDAGSVEELIERADEALLAAKGSGKDRIYLVGQAAEMP
jgi:diguanylate cyclase (GGDEF)-like protein